MTDLADGVVYSRSGLTYQAGLLEKAGRGHARTPPPTTSAASRSRSQRRAARGLRRVPPGHIEVVRQMLFAPLPAADVKS